MAEVTVTSIICSNDSITFHWHIGTTPHISILYRRSDCSWRYDPDTRSLPPFIINSLNRTLLKQLAASAEKKPVKHTSRKHRERIGTWFAE